MLFKFFAAPAGSLIISEYYYTKTFDNTNSGIAFFQQSTLDLGVSSLLTGIRDYYEKATLNYADGKLFTEIHWLPAINKTTMDY